MPTDISKEIASLNSASEKWRKAVTSSREMILSNLSMISQVPAETFEENKRSEFILERFVESGLDETGTDNIYNAIGKLSNKKGVRNILINTHMDNQLEKFTEQDITITEDKVFGAGVPEDNLALAVLCSLPDIFKKASLKFKSNINLLATTRFHGRGDFEGIRHYIDKTTPKPDFTINLSGLTLGQLDYFTLSRERCDIIVQRNISNESYWANENYNNTIIVTNEIINAILRIPLPRKPRSIINIGMIRGGERYSTISRKTTIRLEILSEDDRITDNTIEQIKTHCTDIGARHGVDITADFFGRHHAKGLSCGHPLIKGAIGVINSLGRKPVMNYSNSEISVPLAKDIPSVSLGLTTGAGGNNPDSYIDINPLTEGILQLLMLIYIIDKGLCDD
jgi:acetylornithine deacetylase/succinyl-diaminopimelate desuccinylase-like protein